MNFMDPRGGLKVTGTPWSVIPDFHAKKWNGSKLEEIRK